LDNTDFLYYFVHTKKVNHINCMQTAKETNKIEKSNIYTPNNLKAINKHLKQGDLIEIAITANTSYSHVRQVMTGNRGFCVCRNTNTQKIVETALTLIALRKSEAIEKRNLALEQIKVARDEASALQIAISEMENLLQPQPQQNN
jgi:hypothetical protein